ncbi:tRNA intron endonuclease [Gloeopeniophorella convolvens]|nr:tRNA intron endonuclease [Gloeopeniophorella convolvens]
MADRIPVHVSNQRAFVWDVDHAATLRSQHRICGMLSGTLPHLSQQNVFLGLPLALMPEELVLLVEKQIAVIVHDPAAHHPPTRAQLDAWDAARREGVTAQLARAEAEAGRRNEDRAQNAAAQEKRAAREARRHATPDVGVDDALAPAPAPTPARTPAAPNTPHTVAVPTTSSGFAWYDARASTYDTLDAARAAGVWSFPRSDAERARCAVFRDLWEKGYYMGGGSKFGGDWLVYPGDPLRYHSHFVATVQTALEAPLRPMEIVAHGRLGTATKKAHLLCGWDSASREVTYLSVEWAGFG